MTTTKKLTGRRAPHSNPVKLVKPGDNDILCGKDRACALHKGSQRFRTVIDSYRGAYMKAVTKYDKMCLTKEIYEVLSQDARFLKYNDKEKVWEEISPLAGRDKIGHALRFANNHSAAGKGKKPRRTMRRQGSFSSTSATSAASSAFPNRTKMELVKDLVEVAKEEPKVWGSIVDHLTLQDALAAVPDGEVVSEPAAAAAAARHQRVASIVDSVALENIAYAVESKTDDAALDDLIHLLSNDEIITEEDIQDVLAMADEAVSNKEVPQTISVAPISNTDSSESQPSEPAYDIGSAAIRKEQAVAAQMHHARGYSMDDDIWSVMKEPILDADDWD